MFDDERYSKMAMPQTLDDALEKNPVGPFHYRLLLLCGLSFMADALEVNLLTFLATCAGDKWNLSTTQEASITSVVFGGIIAGSLFWGSFADRYGRRMCFLWAAAVITIAGFLSCAAPNYPVLLVLRAIVGFGIGGASVPFDLLAEFLPASNRGSFLVFIEYFWTFGSMYVAACAWIILPISDWRVLAAITALPIAITSVLSIWFLPESPRWLLSQGRVEEAEKVVAASYIANGQQDVVIKLIPEHKGHNTSSSHHQEPPTPATIATGSSSNTYEGSKPGEEEVSYLDIFRDPALRRFTIPLWAVWMLFGFTYYGLILFVGRVYSTDDGGSDDNNKCSFDYSSIFYNSTAEIVGTTCAILFIDRIGRVNMQVLFYFLAGVFVALVGVGLPPWGILVVAYIGRISIMASSNATWVLTPELYPTQYRTFGHALCVVNSKIGAFMCPYIVVSALSVPTVSVILGVANVCASIAAYMLPEAADQALGEKTYERRSISQALSVDGIQASLPGSKNGGTDALESSLLENGSRSSSL